MNQLDIALAPKKIRLRDLLKAALRRTRRAGQRGMTLIEIMVVMALIGIIGTVVAVNVIGAQKDGDIDAARILVNTTVPNALTAYYSRNSSEFPESLEVLVEQKRLKKNQIVDPWNKPLIYEPSGGEYRLCSSGPDKVAGNGDDVCKDEE